MRALEVVVLHPEIDPPAGVLQVYDRHLRQALLPQTSPEAFDLAAGLRMPRLAPDVLDVVLGELLLELGLPSPVRIGRPIVRQDLPRRAVLGDRPPQDLKHVPGRRPHVQPPAHHEARVVVQVSDQLGLPAVPESHREDIRLPHLAGLGTLKTPHHVLVPPTPGLLGRYALPVQGSPHALPAHAKVQEPLQRVADPPHAPAGILPLRRNDLPYNRLRQPMLHTALGLLLAFAPGHAVGGHCPPGDGLVAQAQLPRYGATIGSGSLQKLQDSGFDLGWVGTPTSAFFRRPPPSPLGERGGSCPSFINVCCSHSTHSLLPEVSLQDFGMCQPIAGISSGHSSWVRTSIWGIHFQENRGSACSEENVGLYDSDLAPSNCPEVLTFPPSRQSKGWVPLRP